jgi:hypothetical protein
MISSLDNYPGAAAEPGKATSYTLVPKQDAEGKVDGDLLEISMGPQHPSTHGVFRMDVVLDGEHVVKLKPVFGYLHRNHEKIGENTTYLASMPYTDRLDYLCSSAKPHMLSRFSPSGYGGSRHAADVCIPRARTHPRPF